MKIVSIVGARPEFVQATPISRALRPHHQEILVHTGQHYDYAMSQTFFEELNIPAPDYYLGVGSGSHAKQTAEMMVRMEEVLLAERPDVVVVRGDTNSTIAGALVAAKLGMPLAHVEAGERSFDRSMPEEINRLVTDRLADMHFCVSRTAVEHLADEGILGNVHWVGDVMYDVMLSQIEIARQKSTILQTLGVEAKGYALVTVHRAANTDDPARLTQIVDALNSVDETVIFPVHPRTRKALGQIEAVFAPHVRLIEPVGYFDIITLEESARLIATDSGGVQREAYFLGVPCITLRDETEWHETVSAGWNSLVGVETETILDAWRNFRPSGERPAIFGEGDAGRKIADILTASQQSTVADMALEKGVLV
ncbi:UDP-N-acetylglucosamine 2-epimerase (non-hydrolyzing) [bacterium]|nr:UDP-N-acetylglucosamine 2-epimerase (non-hydrolyzing) [bacterium]